MQRTLFSQRSHTNSHTGSRRTPTGLQHTNYEEPPFPDWESLFYNKYILFWEMLGKSKDADSACDKISVYIPNSLANILLVERIRDLTPHSTRLWNASSQNSLSCSWCWKQFRAHAFGPSCYKWTADVCSWCHHWLAIDIHSLFFFNFYLLIFINCITNLDLSISRMFIVFTGL